MASLSMDLDNLWSYRKTHGDPGWETFPSYLDIAVPRILEFLRARGLTITFFVVGQDAEIDANREAFEALAASGHEIANHTFHHDPWLHTYSAEDLERELERAERAIEQATGRRTVGFRGPGFSLSPAVLRVLSRRGYLYDASTLPSFLNPLARTYFLMTSKLSAEEKKRRKALFGSFRDGLRPIKPYRWPIEDGGIIEIPVTTMPILRVPMHASYVLYLGQFSRTLARAYFRAAVRLCLLTRTEPSLLLHPLDFLGCDDTEALSFFPAMRVPSQKKIELVSDALGFLLDRFTPVTMEEHANRVAAASPRESAESRASSSRGE